MSAPSVDIAWERSMVVANHLFSDTLAMEECVRRSVSLAPHWRIVGLPAIYIYIFVNDNSLFRLPGWTNLSFIFCSKGIAYFPRLDSEIFSFLFLTRFCFCLPMNRGLSVISRPVKRNSRRDCFTRISTLHPSIRPTVSLAEAPCLWQSVSVLPYL